MQVVNSLKGENLLLRQLGFIFLKLVWDVRVLKSSRSCVGWEKDSRLFTKGMLKRSKRPFFAYLFATSLSIFSK